MDIGQDLSLMLGLPTVSSWTTNERPKNAKRGTFGYNSDTYSLEYYNGDYWFTAPMSRV